MKLHHLLAGLALGAAATAAGAVVVIADRDQPGDQGVLYDTETQLDWLRSPPEFSSPIPPGFAVASGAQLQTFFTNVGLTDWSGSVVFHGSGPFVEPAMRPFSVLWFDWAPGAAHGTGGPVSTSSMSFVYGTADAAFPFPGPDRLRDSFYSGALTLRYEARDRPNVFEWAVHLGGLSSRQDLQNAGAGLALVRNHVPAIPEPATYALMLTGLAIVGWAKNRRVSRRTTAEAAQR